MRTSAFGWLARSVLSNGSSTGRTAPPLVPPSRASRARTRAGGPGVDGDRSGRTAGIDAAGSSGRGEAVVTGSSTATGTTSSATWRSPDFRPVTSITAAHRGTFLLRQRSLRAKCDQLQSDRDQAMHVEVGGGQPVTAAQEGELEQHAHTREVAAGLAHERSGRGHGAAGREYVIDDQDPLPGGERVALDLEDGLAILQRVGRLERGAGQFALLANRDEAGAEVVGHRRREDEAARLDADDLVDGAAAVMRDDRVDSARECDVIGEQRADVLEQHARPGVV